MGTIISTKDVIIPGLNQTLYEIILDQSSDPIFCFSPEGRYLYINQAFSKAFNLMPSDIVGKLIWDVFPGAAGDMRFAAVNRAIETKEEVILEVKVDSVTGPRYFITTVTPILNQTDIPQAAICISKDITKRKEMEQDLHLAHALTEQKNVELDQAIKELYVKSIMDLLKGLYNRQHAIDLLDEAVVRYNERQTPLSLMFIDLDDYKKINDDYGHIEGDVVLKQFSAALKAEFSSIGHVGRYGGDEFIVVLPNVTLSEAVQLADAFRLKISHMLFGEHALPMTTSIGVGLYAGQGVAKFVKYTDDAMYKAKTKGRNQAAY